MNISKPNISRPEKVPPSHHPRSAILDWCYSEFHWDRSSSLELVSYTWLEENKYGHILCHPIDFPFVTISGTDPFAVDGSRKWQARSSPLSWKSVFRILTFLRNDYTDHIHFANMVAVLVKLQRWCLSLVSIGCFRPRKSWNPFSQVTQLGAILGGFLDVCCINSPLAGTFIRLIVFELQSMKYGFTIFCSFN